MTLAPQVTAAEAVKLVDDGALLVDVREAMEWNSAHAPMAVHVPLMTLPDYLDKFDKEKPVVVICASGSRSDRAAQYLRSIGYDATSASGGLFGWMHAGGQVQAG